MSDPLDIVSGCLLGADGCSGCGGCLNLPGIIWDGSVALWEWMTTPFRRREDNDEDPN